jgi:hypothetical protein
MSTTHTKEPWTVYYTYDVQQAIQTGVQILTFSNIYPEYKTMLTEIMNINASNYIIIINNNNDNNRSCCQSNMNPKYCYIIPTFEISSSANMASQPEISEFQLTGSHVHKLTCQKQMFHTKI